MTTLRQQQYQFFIGGIIIIIGVVILSIGIIDVAIWHEMTSEIILIVIGVLLLWVGCNAIGIRD